jgi:heterodisulfide reductase subunit A
MMRSAVTKFCGKLTSKEANMSVVLVIGGGLSGSVIAKELAENGKAVIIIEADKVVGGKVREYGCKATDECNNCGVCLTSGLWEAVEKNDLIKVIPSAKIIDLSGTNGDFTAAVKTASGIENIVGISEVVVATGFKKTTEHGFGGSVEIENTDNIMLGSKLENVLKDRNGVGIFEKEPKSVAFVQCVGSRDCKDNALYCSKVCCAYTTRAAKVIKHYYPQVEIAFFYMEMQMVVSGNYFDSITESGFDFIKCRPIKITGGVAPEIVYDNPNSGKRENQSFDMIVLADGIRANDDAGRIAELCGFNQTSAGFLQYVESASDGQKTGIYLAGSVKGPLKIEEAYNDSIAVAREILFA